MNARGKITVEVVMAWPRRFVAVTLQLPPASTIAEAVVAAKLSGIETVTGYALHGIKGLPSTPLRDGDRVELLRPLQTDPKEARRRRAVAKTRDAKASDAKASD